jgi:hypothetical protein
LFQFLFFNDKELWEKQPEHHHRKDEKQKVAEAASAATAARCRVAAMTQ